MPRFQSTYNRILRLMCLVLALHLLNGSIDSRDPHPEVVPEDLSFNDIESVTELFAEVVFGWTNAFAEHDEKDSDDGVSFDVVKFYFNNSSVLIDHPVNSVSARLLFVIRNSTGIASPPRDVTSPPPKA